MVELGCFLQYSLARIEEFLLYLFIYVNYVCSLDVYFVLWFIYFFDFKILYWFFFKGNGDLGYQVFVVF